MSLLSRLVKKVVNLVTGKKDNVPVAIPPAAKAAGSGGLPGGIRRAVETTFQSRIDSEIKQNSSSRTPLPSKYFADSLAEEYDKWFRTLHAGIMSPNPIGLPALKIGIRTYMFSGWGTAFAAYWQTVVWQPTGIYTGGITTNATAIGAALQSELNSLLLSRNITRMSGGSDAFAERIADILYTYTTKLIVQATLSVPPNTKTETVI